MRIKRIIGLGTLALVAALAVTFVTVFADSWSTNFESFSPVSVNGQNGWSCTNPNFDQSVVANGYGYSSFGGQSFRISDAYTSGTFGDQTFTRSLANEAGEADALNSDGTTQYSGGVRQSHFEAKFDFASTTAALQPGMHVSVSPDRGDGARMSYLRFEDQADGIHVFFDDVTDPGHAVDGDSFSDTDIATLTRAPHTVKFMIDFVNGSDNDVVKIYIDGVLKITGTTWEDYYRYDHESNPTLANNSRTVDSLLIREAGGADPNRFGMGFLFDNFSLVSSNPPANADACKSNGWQTRSRAADGSAFKNQGDCIQYVNTGK
jgi:hypothetical protein